MASNILTNIFTCVQQKKDIYADLEQPEGEEMTEFSILGEHFCFVVCLIFNFSKKWALKELNWNTGKCIKSVNKLNNSERDMETKHGKAFITTNLTTTQTLLISSFFVKCILTRIFCTGSIIQNNLTYRIILQMSSCLWPMESYDRTDFDLKSRTYEKKQRIENIWIIMIVQASHIPV